MSFVPKSVFRRVQMVPEGAGSTQGTLCVTPATFEVVRLSKMRSVTCLGVASTMVQKCVPGA